MDWGERREESYWVISGLLDNFFLCLPHSDNRDDDGDDEDDDDDDGDDDDNDDDD